jgi:hypothetical protein
MPGRDSSVGRIDGLAGEKDIYRLEAVSQPNLIV